jgi:hypothetical protein
VAGGLISQVPGRPAVDKRRELVLLIGGRYKNPRLRAWKTVREVSALRQV